MRLWFSRIALSMDRATGASSRVSFGSLRRSSNLPPGVVTLRSLSTDLRTSDILWASPRSPFFVSLRSRRRCSSTVSSRADLPGEAEASEWGVSKALGRVIKRKIVSSRSFSCQISLDHFSGTMGCPPFHHPDTLLKDAMNIEKLNPHPSYVILQTTKCVGTAGKWYCSYKLKGHNSSQLTNSCTASLNARI